MTLSQVVQLFLADCKWQNLAAGTCRHYVMSLKRLTDELGDRPFDAITVAEIKAILAKLKAERKWQDATLNHSIVAVKRLYNWAYQEELLDTNPMARLKKVACASRLPEPLTPAQMKTLIETATAPRDQALILLALDTGLRVGELSRLTYEDVNLAAGTIMVHLGKGRKDRVVPMSPPARKALARWLARLPDDAPTLWPGERGPLSPDGMFAVIRTLGTAAGIPRLHPHRLRHSFAHGYLQGGGTLAGLQRILGHTTAAMTQRYAHVAALDVVEIHAAVSPVGRLFGKGGRR